MTAVPPCEPFCGPIPPAGAAGPQIAGEVEFGAGGNPDFPFLFTGDFTLITSGFPITFTPVTFATTTPPSGRVIELDPNSSPEFDSPSPGILRYVGNVPRRFKVSANFTFLWPMTVENTPPLKAGFIAALLINGVVDDNGEGSSAWATSLNRTADPEVVIPAVPSTHHMQDMLLLNPGDELQVGLFGVVGTTGTPTIGVALNLLITTYTIIATSE